jgi:hypothetical protein
MLARKRALEAFYGGPVWNEHGSAANATMVDVSNVLLLRPLSQLELDTGDRPGPGATRPQSGLLAVTVHPLAGDVAVNFGELFDGEVEPALRKAGISVVATFVTEHSENTFPQLPLCEDVNVFAWMAIYADEPDHARRGTALEGSPAWRDQIAPVLARQVTGVPEVLRLTPTARSLLHG